MPLITVNIIENVFNEEEKATMIAKLTDIMVAIEGEGMRPVTWVKIEEVPEGQWVGYCRNADYRCNGAWYAKWLTS